MSQNGANPLDELRSLHADVQRDADDLLERAEMGDLIRGITDRLGRLPQLVEQLARLQSRGYAYTGPEQAALAALQAEGPGLSDQLRREARQVADQLRPRADVLVRKIRAIPVAVEHGPSIRACDADRDSLKTTLQARERELDSRVDPWRDRYDALERGLKDRSEQLDLFEKATFQLEAGELPVGAVPATWEDHKEGNKPKGVLFLTSLRLRFEQREKVAKKKFLFFTTDETEVQQLMMDEPIGHLRSSDDSTRGMIMKDQLLTLVWAPESKVPGDKSLIEVDKGTAKQWDALIEDVKSGAIARLKPGAEASTAASQAGHRAVNAPTVCSACGAQMPPPVAGQSRLACPYCGTDHQLALA
jgi:hypothetical protein